MAQPKYVIYTILAIVKNIKSEQLYKHLQSNDIGSVEQ